MLWVACPTPAAARLAIGWPADTCGCDAPDKQLTIVHAKAETGAGCKSRTCCSEACCRVSRKVRSRAACQCIGAPPHASIAPKCRTACAAKTFCTSLDTGAARDFSLAGERLPPGDFSKYKYSDTHHCQVAALARGATQDLVQVLLDEGPLPPGVHTQHLPAVRGEMRSEHVRKGDQMSSRDGLDEGPLPPGVHAPHLPAVLVKG